MASNAAMASEIGKTRYAEAAEAATSTTRADSVAYATEDRGSDAKIGRARVFGSSVSSSSPLAIGRPTIARLSGRTGPGLGNARLTSPRALPRPARWRRSSPGTVRREAPTTDRARRDGESLAETRWWLRPRRGRRVRPLRRRRRRVRAGPAG